MKRFIVTESEKEQIRKQHKDLKKILIEKLHEKYENPRILISEDSDWREIAKTGCDVFKVSSPIKYKYSNGTTALKVIVDNPFMSAYVAKNGATTKFDIGDYLYFFENGTFDIYDGKEIANKNWVKKQTLKWGCKALEDFKNKKPYQTQELPQTSKEQEDMLAYYKSDRGGKWKEEREIESWNLRNFRKEHVPDSERYWKPNGIELYRPITGLDAEIGTTSSSENVKNKEAEASVSNCIKTIDEYWRQFIKKLYPNPNPRLKAGTQACVNQHYGDGDWGGVFSGKDKKYDRIIEVLTRMRPEYDKHKAPVEDSPWLLIPRDAQ
jgi:hypothetical protein